MRHDGRWILLTAIATITTETRQISTKCNQKFDYERISCHNDIIEIVQQTVSSLPKPTLTRIPKIKEFYWGFLTVNKQTSTGQQGGFQRRDAAWFLR